MGCFAFLTGRERTPKARKRQDASDVLRTVLLKLSDEDEKDAHSLLKELDNVPGIQASLRAACRPGLAKHDDRTAGYTHIIAIRADDIAGLQTYTTSTVHGKLMDLVLKDDGKMQPIIIDSTTVTMKEKDNEDKTKGDKDIELEGASIEKEPYEKIMEQENKGTEQEETKKLVHIVSQSEVQEVPKPSKGGGSWAPAAAALVYRGAANSVHARGEWDGWLQDLVLARKHAGGDWHAELPRSWKGMHYKFIVDGVWTVDESQAVDFCGAGHTNNVYPGFNEALRSSSRPRRTVEGQSTPRERRRR